MQFFPNTVLDKKIHLLNVDQVLPFNFNLLISAVLYGMKHFDYFSNSITRLLTFINVLLIK